MSKTLAFLFCLVWCVFSTPFSDYDDDDVRNIIDCQNALLVVQRGLDQSTFRETCDTSCRNDLFTLAATRVSENITFQAIPFPSVTGKANVTAGWPVSPYTNFQYNVSAALSLYSIDYVEDDLVSLQILADKYTTHPFGGVNVTFHERDQFWISCVKELKNTSLPGSSSNGLYWKLDNVMVEITKKFPV